MHPSGVIIHALATLCGPLGRELLYLLLQHGHQMLIILFQQRGRGWQLRGEIGGQLSGNLLQGVVSAAEKAWNCPLKKAKPLRHTATCCKEQVLRADGTARLHRQKSAETAAVSPSAAAYCAETI